MIEAISLTVMSDIDGSSRSKNGESSGIIEAGGGCGVVIDLAAGTESISVHVRGQPEL